MSRPPRKPLWSWIFVVLVFGFASGIGQAILGHTHARLIGIGDILEGFWPVAGICLLAIAMGRAGRFLAHLESDQKTNVTANTDPVAEKKPRLQFSLARLLVATAAVAIVFAFSRIFLGSADPFLYSFSGIVGGAVGSLVLFAKKSDFSRIAMSILLGGFGGLIGLVWGSDSMGFGRQEPFHALCYAILPAIVGWILGCILSRWDERIRRRK